MFNNYFAYVFKLNFINIEFLLSRIIHVQMACEPYTNKFLRRLSKLVIIGISWTSVQSSTQHIPYLARCIHVVSLRDRMVQAPYRFFIWVIWSISPKMVNIMVKLLYSPFYLLIIWTFYHQIEWSIDRLIPHTCRKFLLI